MLQKECRVPVSSRQVAKIKMTFDEIIDLISQQLSCLTNCTEYKITTKVRV